MTLDELLERRAIVLRESHRYDSLLGAHRVARTTEPALCDDSIEAHTELRLLDRDIADVRQAARRQAGEEARNENARDQKAPTVKRLSSGRPTKRRTSRITRA